MWIRISSYHGQWEYRLLFNNNGCPISFSNFNLCNKPCNDQAIGNSDVFQPFLFSCCASWELELLNANHSLQVGPTRINVLKLLLFHISGCVSTLRRNWQWDFFSSCLRLCPAIDGKRVLTKITHICHESRIFCEFYVWPSSYCYRFWMWYWCFSALCRESTVKLHGKICWNTSQSLNMLWPAPCRLFPPRAKIWICFLFKAK